MKKFLLLSLLFIPFIVFADTVVVTVEIYGALAPENFAATSVGTSTVSFEWDASVGATYYKLYKDSVLDSTTTDTSATVDGLSPATEYTFYVTAIDSSEMESSASDLVTLTTDSITTINSNPLPGQSSEGGYGKKAENKITARRGSSVGVKMAFNDPNNELGGKKLILKLSADGAEEMQISDNPLFIGANWEDYKSETELILPDRKGIKNIYVRFKGESGLRDKVFVDYTIQKEEQSFVNVLINLLRRISKKDEISFEEPVEEVVREEIFKPVEETQIVDNVNKEKYDINLKADIGEEQEGIIPIIGIILAIVFFGVMML